MSGVAPNEDTKKRLIDLGVNLLQPSRLIDTSILDRAAELRQDFESAQPFPHIVLENLFNPELLEAVLADFASVDDSAMVRQTLEDTVDIRRSRDWTPFGPAAEAYFSLINSRRFLEFLSNLTGVKGLIADAMLHNGGLHESRSGGKFGLHLDFTHHPVTKLDNRLVCITYLNHDWRDEFGGELELWSAEKGERVASVKPEFGRTIIFAQSPVSLHGHPNPIRLPDDRRRRSLASYYYTNGLDDQAAAFRYGTAFAPYRQSSAAVRIAKRVLPPIVTDLGRWLRSKTKTAQ
jgi:Rps23 Pro-64 3,4-dihydroxylase Tpa1-like proline 4-hydroxylase